MSHHHAGHSHAGHSHAGHSHAHVPANFGRIFAIAAFLNISLVVIQVVYGVLAHSVALLADAGHNFRDVVGLLLAWGAHGLSGRSPTKRYTYGFWIRFDPGRTLERRHFVGGDRGDRVGSGSPPVRADGGCRHHGHGRGFDRSRHQWRVGLDADGRFKGGFEHPQRVPAHDRRCGVSLGVVFVGGGIVLTGWLWLDPVMSLIISAVIVWGTWSLLRDAVKLSLAAVPDGIDPLQVRAYLEGLPGVKAAHDLHIWAMSTRETALTCHLVMPKGHPGDAFSRGGFTRVASSFSRSAIPPCKSSWRMRTCLPLGAGSRGVGRSLSCLSHFLDGKPVSTSLEKML